MSDHAWDDFVTAVADAWPPSRFCDLGVVVGCSGGADSVALLRGLDQLRRTVGQPRNPQGFLVVAHFNHRLRGDDSAADAEWVASVANELGWPLELGAGDGSRSDERTLRERRFEFFTDVLRRSGARYLALGHSLDDNVETVLHRLLRGTGPRGMTGIEPFRPLTTHGPGSDFVVARPMLQIRREAIRSALRSRGYLWREDPSNQSIHYQRNWIRHELMPLLQSRYPDADAAIARTIAGQRQWADVLDPFVEDWLRECVLCQNPLELKCLDDSGTHPLNDQAVAIEALRSCWQSRCWPLAAMDRDHWNRLFDVICGRGEAAITLPGGVQVRRHATSITITREG